MYRMHFAAGALMLGLGLVSVFSAAHKGYRANRLNHDMGKSSAELSSRGQEVVNHYCMKIKSKDALGVTSCPASQEHQDVILKGKARIEYSDVAILGALGVICLTSAFLLARSGRQTWREKQRMPGEVHGILARSSIRLGPPPNQQP